MQRRVLRTTTALAATCTIAGLTAAAGAQQTFQRGQPEPWQSQGQSDQYEQQRQQRMQRQFDQQQQRMQQQAQQQRRQQQFGQQPGSGQQALVGVDFDGDGRADSTFAIPSEVAQHFARMHEQQEMQGQQMELGMGQQGQASRQPQQLRQQWQQIQQSQMRGEPTFEDLPVSPRAARGMSRVQPAQLSGTVTEARTVQLIGQGEPTRIAKVRTQDGATVFVDLGPEQQNRNVQLYRGDRVQLQGTPAWLNNQPVIFADRIQTEEGTASINRPDQAANWQQQQQQQQQFQQQPRQQQQRFERERFQQSGMEQPWSDQQSQQTQGQSETIRGEVASTHRLRIGRSEPYLFVTLEDQQGRERLVNLGPASRIQGVVSEGDQIQVRAIGMPLMGETVYHAEQVNAGGQNVRIQQTGMSAGGSEQTRVLRGTIKDTEEVRIGRSQPYLFATLEDEQGREQLVNLGPADQVEDLVEEGDDVQVQAVSTPLMGQTVFYAHQIRANGESMQIQQTRYNGN